MKRGAASDRHLSFPAARPSLPLGRPSAVPGRPSSPPPTAAHRRREVDASDLDRLDVLQALLLTLNDPRASAVSIARHVQDLEVLAARIEERFLRRQGGFAPRLTGPILAGVLSARCVALDSR